MSSLETIENIYRLSPLQEGMLFHSLSDPDAGQYVEQTHCTVEGDLDPAALRRGWDAAVARHSVLRASFHWEEVDRPVQAVYRQVEVPWREEDWRGLPEEAQEARFSALLDADRRLGFDLGRPPLLRITLVRLGERAWRFLWSHHHLLLDGWSLTRVLEEVFAGYAGLSGLPPARPFVDYIAWLEQQDLAAAETFWRQTLAGFATATPLPLSSAVAVRGTPSFEDRVLDLPAPESAGLDEAARRAGVTLGTLVQAAWALFLSRATGEEDVLFGTVVSGRPPHLRGSESMVGLFINTLPVRVRIEERDLLAPWLRRVQEHLLELRRFEHSPLADVQAWSGVRPGEPLFQTLMAFENFPRGASLQGGLDGLEVRDIEVSERTNYPLNVAAVPLAEGLQLRLSWDRRFYDPETAERLLGHLRTLLASMAAGLDRPLEDLSLLDGIPEWNGAVEPVPEVTIDVLLERTAQVRGDAPAVEMPDGTTWTYRELQKRAACLAGRLRELGVGPEIPVGLCLERSPDLIAAMLGVWKAGGFWVPLDPEYPAERLRFLREDAGVAVLVSREKDLRGLKVSKDRSNTAETTPDNPAYILYTSGSTGQPKGVVVSHRSLVSHLLAARRLLGLGPGSRVPQTASPSFDASILEIFSTLLAGGTVVLLSRDTLLSGAGLADELRRLGITAMASVPSLLATLPERDLPALRTVMTGAERCPADLAVRWAAGRGFLNVYGPTETTIFITVHEGAGEPPQGPPIGRPIANAEAFVVDRRGRLVPPGVPGELWLGGVSLARGYLRQPALTAERFVPHPFSRQPGARLYRSGDLVRRRPDGQLEYLGRIDRQVKIRGHRVECGEVEAALARHPAVKEAAVIGRDGSLVAYIVPSMALEPGGLRRFLATTLPAWMIPGAWVILDALPLSPSGKVDRRALARIDPEPERCEAAGAGAPRSPAEEILARVWAEVLRIERVGVHDDFFDLGGNSILSIQVVSRAAEAGLQVTPRQVFENPTVGALAAVAVPAGGEAGTVAVEGPAPLTPIQRSFFEREPADPHRFNMSLLLTPRVPFDTVALERALGILLDRHDALRLRFEKREGEWTQRVEAPGGPAPLVWIDLSALPPETRETAFAEAADALQGSLDLERIMVRAGLLDGRLLLIVHHLAVDAVSWRVLLEDFERAYAGDRMPFATIPFSRWAGKLEEHAETAEAARELPFWRAQADAAAGRPPLPVDRMDGDDTEATSRLVAVSLDPATTRAFLRDAHRAYQTRPDELLLAALVEAVGSWTGERALWIDVEGHGREPVFPGAEGIDLSRTVGWFTTIHPVWLDLRGSHGPGAAIQAAKESLRRVPHRGLGYGILRHLMGETFPQPEIAFNYLGQVDLLLGSPSRFEVDPAPPGLPRSPRAARPYRLEINAFVRDGRLTVSWTHGERRHRRETVERLAEGFLAALTGLIEHCLAPEAGGFTPSDFYPLSPLQEGMLFESLYASEGDAYVVQAAWTLGGDLDPVALRRAWEHLAERHAVLRTSFHWKERERPHQMAHPRVELPWTEEDWRELPAGERERRLEEREAAGRAAGFDLGTAPLFRLLLVRLEDRLWSLVWTQHHLLLDGWSVGLVLRELFAAYGAFRRGADPGLPPARPFRAYIEWLLRRDGRDAEAFWRRELAGFTAPTPVGGTSGDRHAFGARGRAGAVLDPADLAALGELARCHRLTLNTFVQGAWAQLLARRSGEDDVVFGVVVSGRVVSGQPAELPGIESAVGPFINTIPLRARLAPGDRLLPWLAALQERQVEARGFEHSSLVEIQGWSEVPRGLPLFESLLAFEGSLYDPSLAEGACGVRVLAARTNQVSRAPLTLVAVPEGERLDLSLIYDRDRFEVHEIPRRAGHLRELLLQMAAHPERPLGELSFLTEAERQQILFEWQVSFTSFEPFRSFNTLHGLFLAQAKQNPQAVALVFEDERITYGDLAGRSGRLAARLRELGVGPEVRVAVSLPRSPELVVTILAILQAGGAYVPLDPDDPPERRAWIAADCGAALVVTETGVGAGETPAVPGGGLPESLAYVIYTSGTTGRPKGAMVPHGAAVNHILWAQSAYGLEREDAGLLKTPMGFDVSVRELFWPLSVGARVVIARPGGERDPGYLIDLIRREGVTVANFVPSLLAAVLDAGPAAGLKRIIAGGETLPADLAGRCLWLLPDTSLHNHYGPTETAVNATAWACRPGERPVPIGRPIANVRIGLLDTWGNPVPIGAAGEVHIGGTGVGRGYLRRPELTAERFVPDPREPGARQYSSGDLARWRPDGALEFLGRRDHQIKVRGLRVEPEEVEAVLSGVPGVREAVVVARDGALVAFVVAPDQKVGALRGSLASRVPAYLIPSAFVPVDSLPRTPGGKVDRRALAQREVEAAAHTEADFAPPRTPVEEQVAEVWSEVLGRPRVGAHDDFFSLGGHSLLALQVAGRLRETLGVEIPLRRIFEAPTLAALAREVETALLAGSGPLPPPLVPVPRDREIPLSFSQESLWLLHQLDPASPAYNIPAAVRISGRLDPAVLERTLSEIVRRHEALRTTFPGGRPVQEIHPPRPVPLPRVDLADLPPDRGDAEARRLAREEALRPFDLARGPLLRATLARLAEEEHLVLLTMHHAVSDEWSVAVLVREIGAIYLSSPLPELSIQVADHAVWQREWLRGAVLEERLAWWRERLAGAPPVLELPLDRPRTAARSFRGGRVPLEIPAATAERLRRLGRARSASLFMVLLAGFQAWLARHGAGTDPVVGIPVANRSHPGTEGLIGFLVNTLPLRGDLSGDPGFGALVERSREVCLGAFARQDLPFERLVREVRPERSLAHAPLFQVMLALHTVTAPVLDLPGLSFRPLEVDPGTAKFDLVLDLREGPGDAPAVLGSLEHAADLFDRTTAERLAGHLAVLLEAAVADPELPLAALPLLTLAEARQIAEQSAVQATFPAACLHHLFAARAAERPDARAVDETTYAELDRQANRLARRLRRLGVGPETRVALRHGRTPGLVAGILGILKAGGAYVPIDLAWPAERQRLLLEDAGASVLVDEELLAAAREESAEPLDVPVRPDNLAYVIYTSGSTGRPKGTLVSHAHVARLLAATRPWLGFGPDDVWTLFHSAAFDFSVWEIWGALAHGGRLVVVPTEVARSAEDLWSLIDRERVTVLNQTPSAFRPLARLPVPASLRQVIFGGEALDAGSLAGWIGRGPRLINMYGITETTVHVTYRPISGADLQALWRSPIGIPLPDLSVHVLDRRGAPVPAGVPGELCVGGAGVARGYLGRPDLTAGRFVPDPFGAPGDRLYRSGDLARRRASGELEYLGRIDQQVKLRGFRIEPAEIETALTAEPGVRDAAVLLRDDLPAGPGLVAYVVGGPSAGDLLAALRARLPDFMIPGHFVVLPALPLTANGKLDRAALPAPEGERPDLARPYVAPRTPLERVLAGAWEEALGVGRVGIEDGFFDLGGHSLLATQMISWVRETFEVELPLRELFERPTVAGLAAALERLETAEARPIPRRRDPASHPLSFSQERLWFLDRLDPESPAYNIPAALRLRGRLDAAALARALREVARRHEVLRATFHDQGGQPFQRVAPASPAALPVIDLQALPPGRREEEARRLAARESARPFRLDEGPLVRARLLRLGAEEHVLGLEAHHIVADGWSLGVLVRELTALYAGTTLPDLPIQYADWAAWQRERLTGAVLEEQIAWWRERLKGSPPSLDLPTDRPRPAAQTFQGARAAGFLPAELTDRLRSLAGGAGASLFMVLLAAFQLLLARWSGQEDVPVGSPIAGRTRREAEGLIGLFLNNLVLRTGLSGDPTFRELLGRVREVAVGAYGHQDLPFETLLAELAPHRDLSRTPLFQVLFNLLSFPAPDLRLPGLAIEGLDAPPEPQSKFDLTFYLIEREGGVRIDLVYNAGLFDAARMDEALAQYRLLLEQAAADPGARIGSFSLVTGAARAVLPDPAEELDASWPGSVADAVARHARATPDRPAVLWEGGELSYRQLDEQVDRVASTLQAGGIGRGGVVAIQGHRSAPLVPAILGVLRAGAAFMILDPSHPEHRNAEILDLANPKRILHIKLSPLPGAGWEMGEGGRGGEVGRGKSPETPEATDLACLAFTSGSTGTPKGVLGLHRSLTHFLPWMSQAFQLGPEDRFSLLSGLAHDPLQRDIFTPLWLGAAVVIPDPERMAEPGWLAGWMARTGVTVANLTPAMSRLLTEAPAGPLPALRRAFFVGDALTRRDVEQLRALAPEVACVNLYGATETQRALSWHRIEEDDAREICPLGRGMPDVQLLVLSRAGLLAGIGEAGEICVRSPHLAAGYLDDPELTAERFVPDPFQKSCAGDRLYRTGDLGRYRPDGVVEPLGRTDQQVKIRGFRVEPGEVEAALARHPAVREAVVVARGEGDDRRLVAYVVPAGGAPDPGVLRTFLGARLPAYMVPATFVFLEALPLTPSRKVDRKALPEPEPPASEGTASLRTPVEELLAAIWSAVLDTDRIGPDDDFFALGGHSLRVTQVLARVREAFGVALPVRSVFESPTLAGLGARIEEALRAGAPSSAPPLVRAPRGGELPLSFAQERLWFLDRLFPGSPAYHMPAALRLRGALDPAVLERALQEIVRRHEILRTTFPEVDGAPRQRVVPFRPPSLPLADLRGLPRDAREAEAERIARAEAARPFDLRQGPLLRAALLRLDEGEWAAPFCTHHIVSDGWSMGVLVREIVALAAGSSLPELPVQYADFAVWQRGWLQGETLAAQAAHWRAALAGAPSVLQLPLDRPRSPGAGRAGTRKAAFPAELARALRELGRREGATLFMVLLAMLQALLHRLTGEDDLVVGSPIANRTHPALEGLIGFFVNTLALRSRIDGEDPGFRELLGRTRATALAAYTHQDLPFEKLVEELRVERSLDHAPVFQVLLVLQNTPRAELELPGLTLAPIPLAHGAAKLDLSLSFVEAGDGLHAALDYDARLFDAPTAERLLERLAVLFHEIATHPERRLSELPVMSEAERQQVVAEWSVSFESFSSFRSFDTLHGLFLARAQQAPESVALVFKENQLTNGELAKRSARWAARLRELGVGPEVRVAVSLPRSPELVEAILAILQAGGAYVPLDPEDPPERRAWIAADCGAALVVTEKGVEAGETPAVPGGGFPESLAYVIYTSGTTGRPKGAMVSHRAAVNHVLWAQSAYGLGPGDAGLLKTPMGFDVSVRELFWPLSVGALVVIARPGGERDPGYLLDLIEREGVTVVNLVPSLLAAVLDRETLPPLTRMISGGEALTVDLAERCFRRLPGTVLHNHYGPTETAVNATAWACRPGERPVPIGRPIANVRIDLLDAWGSPAPIGVAGEVHVGGAGVGRGYLGRPDLTAARFVPDPREPGARQYSTGDLARWRPDGALEFLGRRDHQVKVRGFRIEPEEVEAALSACPGVSEAAVIARDGALVAFVVAADRDSESLRAALATRLPAFLIPSAFVPVDSLPRTASGKVDRRALAQREVSRPAPGDCAVLPRDGVERELARIWEDLLGVRPVGARDDFFALGGHSLLAVRLASRVEARFGRPLPIATLFERRTVEALADWLRPSRAPRASSPLVRIQPDGSRPPLFMVHPGGGGVLCYAELARALGPDQPLYGLQAPGLDGERSPFDRIDAMADLYLEAVRAVQPAGPWHLGGWSFGGLVAYEMACRLADRGEPAGLVALLDVAPRREGRTEDETALLVRGLDEQFLQTVPLSVDELRGLDTGGQVAVVLDKARRAGRLPDALDEHRAAGLVEVFKANLRAARTWVPRPYPGQITVVRAASSDRLGPDPAGGWDALAAAAVITTPGNHLRMVAPPHVDTLAQALRSALDGWR